jgi:hypothetical protein
MRVDAEAFLCCFCCSYDDMPFIAIIFGIRIIVIAIIINIMASQDSSDGISTRLRAGRERNRGSFPGRGKRFFSTL